MGDRSIDDLKFEVDWRYVSDILACQSIADIKAAVAAFISYAESIRGIANGMHFFMLCMNLTGALREWSKRYAAAPRGARVNAVIVPPEHAPVAMLLAFTPLDGSPIEITTALKKFTGLCGELVPPICDAITVPEINRVLNAAQKSYRLIEIVAPTEPLQVIRFHNSHTVYNSLCGIYGGKDKTSDIFLYHPRSVDTYDRIYIFAHELGHALHKALTGDVSVTPEGFDAFNAKYYSKVETLKENQEYFADAVALAILNAKGLGTHFPSRYSKDMSHLFAGYIRGLCEKALQTAGRYTEPLPPPNLP